MSDARDYAIPARIKGAKEIPVRILVKSEPKFCGSIIDVEIAGRCTMLSFRPEMTLDAIQLTASGASIK